VICEEPPRFTGSFRSRSGPGPPSRNADRSGRCLQKAGDHRGALRVNDRIAGELADAVTASAFAGPHGQITVHRVPRASGDAGRGYVGARGLSRVLARPSSLTEDQFRTYASLVEEAFDALIAGERASLVTEELRKDYANLKMARAARTRDWEDVGALEREIVPELERRLASSNAYNPEPITSRGPSRGGISSS